MTSSTTARVIDASCDLSDIMSLCDVDVSGTEADWGLDFPHTQNLFISLHNDKSRDYRLQDSATDSDSDDVNSDFADDFSDCSGCSLQDNEWAPGTPRLQATDELDDDEMSEFADDFSECSGCSLADGEWIDLDLPEDSGDVGWK